ncbi:hypothetical protein V6N11_056114 [Hibiscus sabdariffa]|uniref:Ubiquitin-like protease family profile domain-containing protein n=1 Tax=Hibiscus sabdariffa TaxID=183260 RepID=A0ABR2T2U9_9ROSI
MDVLEYVEISDGVGPSARGTCDYIWNTPLPEDKIIMHFGHMYLTVSDVDSLRPGHWVNSMILDVVGWMLVVEDIGSNCNGRRGYLPCTLSTQLIEGCMSPNELAEFWNAHMKHFGTVSTCETIFIPINSNNQHWYLCVVDTGMLEVKVLDSLPTTRSNSARMAVVKKLIKSLADCFMDEQFVKVFGSPRVALTELRVVLPKVKSQSNGYIVYSILLKNPILYPLY